MLTIDKNVPLSAPLRKGGGEGAGSPIYPFKIMQVGDSFLVNCTGELEFEHARRRVNMAAQTFRKNAGDGWSYAVRKNPDGIRVWRTA